MPAATEPNGATDSATRGPISPRVLLLLGAVALLAYGLDQFTKALIVANLPLGRSVEVLGEIVQFRHVSNSGAAFSLGSGMTWILSLVALGVVVAIIVFAPRIRSAAWGVMFGLVLGGALGNLTDRLFREPGFGVGEVVDFIQIWGFPAIFNVADIAIVASMGLFLLLSLRGVRLDGTRTPDADDDPVDDEDEAEGAEASGRDGARS